MSPLAKRLVDALSARPDIAFEVLRHFDERVAGPWDQGDPSNPDAPWIRWRPGRGDAAVVVVGKAVGSSWSCMFSFPDGSLSDAQAGYATRQEAVDAADDVLRAAGFLLCEPEVQDAAAPA